MEILSNGSTWGGEGPQPIETLFARLQTNVLDPRFEKYGNFIMRDREGQITVWGNFLDYSHVFDVRGTAEELAPLIKAIRAHKRTAKYKQARTEVR